MNSTTVRNIALATAGTVGALALLTACRFGGGEDAPPKPVDPMADLTTDRMATLNRGVVLSGADPTLSLAEHSTFVVRNSETGVRTAIDGTRLLQAADSHAYGDPRITNAAIDIKGDGLASFNEIREVYRHFDANDSGTLETLAEVRAAQSEVGISSKVVD